MDNNLHYDIIITAVCLFDTTETNIIHDKTITPHHLTSSLKHPFLTGYHKYMFNNVLQFLATKKPSEIDYRLQVSDDRLATIKKNEPYTKLSAVKSTDDISKYLQHVRQKREYFYDSELKDKGFLYFQDNLSVYDNSIYLPYKVVLDFQEWENKSFYPHVKYNVDEGKYNIYTLYLMKKENSLNIK